MKRYYLILVVLIFSCSQSKIPASIKAESIHMVKGGFKNNTSLFTITISSDINLVTYYKRKKAVNFYMYCPLVSNDFSGNNRHQELFKLKGFINDEGNTVVKEEKFYNSFRIYFEDINNKIISDQKIKDLINNKKCIQCMLVMPLHVLGPEEQSEAFCIPTTMILENFN